MVLNDLESESIEILREALASAERPTLLYSVGKDSSVLLHLARKAFYPASLPFPLLHVDTGWKFQAMYAHRDNVVRETSVRLIVHRNEAGAAAGITPFTHGAGYYTDVMKTEALKQALDTHGFDVIVGGARRDEEASRAKERVCSFRVHGHRWDPRTQRPELWSIYNLRVHPGETIRVFPLSNWTEFDIWQYIDREGIPVVPQKSGRSSSVRGCSSWWTITGCPWRRASGRLGASCGSGRSVAIPSAARSTAAHGRCGRSSQKPRPR